jgi:aldose 1-epimerase
MASPRLTKNVFGTLPDGRAVERIVLRGESGFEARILTHGAVIQALIAPDAKGGVDDVVLGHDAFAGYLAERKFFGATVGRYANRINQGKITVEGVEYQLPQNNFGHCLHGGPEGWQYKIFDVEQVTDNKLTLVLNSPDGDANFPGNVVAKVTYTLTDENAIDIAYEATTDKTTIINMTNHSYFNLTGDASKPITDCLLTINADNYTPVDSTFMTTGEILPVENTPMDFRTAKAIGKEINNYDFVQLKNGNGYDHNWVLNTAGDITKVAAKVVCPETGITLEVYTDEPGVQIYTGNFLDGTVKGKKGIAYPQRSAICLETQKYPDTPNKPEWPSAILKPGEKYTSHCIFKFGVEK